MKLRFHNQLSKGIDTFAPIDPERIGLYTCGPTVYAEPTVGNWASYIYWDVLVRVLMANGYQVSRVMNITDVGHLVSDDDEGEDKLEKGARRESKTAWEVAQQYLDSFMAGMKQLNLITPQHMPRATEYIPQQLALVRALQDGGHTYQISDGIYFDTATFPSYGDFAGLDIAAQKAGARVEFNPEKRNPSDFALWKFTAPGEHRDMEWITPAALTDDGATPMGFPGWHLECSAMAMSLLGDTIDIHTGGIDHIPIHHTNEIAQSESVTGKPLAHYWLHTNHLKIDGAKISKSLGNGYTLQDLIDKDYSPLDLRMLVLQSHYRTEGNFTFAALDAARQRRLHWRNIAALRHQIHDTLQSDAQVEETSKTVSLYAANQALLKALNDDLDTPTALTLVDEAFTHIGARALKDIHGHALRSFLETIDELLGLDLLHSSPDITDELKQTLVARARARHQKEYTKSDELRDELAEHGIIVRDTPTGQVWEYAA
ncbi:cysteine--tRNA ligase [Candidatus Saccharibacteria bacterium]|nr:cysteine--tRNA ligase [Candidatus Saccharibacteria bacterium]